MLVICLAGMGMQSSRLSGQTLSLFICSLVNLFIRPFIARIKASLSVCAISSAPVDSQTGSALRGAQCKYCGYNCLLELSFFVEC